MRTFIFAAAAALLIAGSASAQYRDPYRSNHGYGSNTYGSTYGGSGYGTGSNPDSHFSRGYTRNNGTYVEPYRATNPNSTQMDNYGTRGNYNPYNGHYGTRKPRY